LIQHVIVPFYNDFADYLNTQNLIEALKRPSLGLQRRLGFLVHGRETGTKSEVARFLERSLAFTSSSCMSGQIRGVR
jgi:hypothetical protein